ncbi:MAG TPA: RNA polymerase sigma factor [Candidatus Paceibacterota bacterium]
MEELPDKEIARRAQRGDTESFGFLVEKYGAKIKRYGKKFLLNREDLEDLTQEVFLKAYANIQSFDARQSFSPWLYRIAHNEFVNAIKKRAGRKIFSVDFDLFFPHPIAAGF